ncbi:hypothetical protein [Ornithinibacillus xuwenensis]|uniref:Uncharacterized protein n=1 Tax=Ornithinibacillus xuwenensis TaxID=3144668 RepID=A0ABU9XK23_9BACI
MYIEILFFILCFYYTLTFIENLHNEDKRVTKQAKYAAIVCLILAFIFLVV